MDFIFNLSLLDGNRYYDFFYQLSLITVFTLFLIYGWRKKYPMSTWILISVISSVVMIIGSKLGTYNFEDWRYFFSTWKFPHAPEKTIIGALFFGWIGIGIAQKVLNFKGSVLDFFAWGIPIGIIIQRIGCLLAGCCFGNPTWSNWGICYSNHHLIYDYHFQEGFVGVASQFTPAVHPIPLYLIFGSFVILLLLKKYQHKFKAQGALALFSVGLIFGWRFFVEFFRDPITNHEQGEIWYGLKIVQWLVLTLAIASFIILFLREKNWKPLSIHLPTEEERFYKNLFISFIVTSFILLSKDWFTIPELKSIFVRVLFFYGFLSVTFYKYFWKKASVRWSMGVIFLSIFFMGQSYPTEHNEKEFKPYTVNQLRLASSTGKADLNYIDRKFRTSGSGCNSSSTLLSADTISIGPHYNSLSANFMMNKYYKPEKSVSLHLYMMAGNYPKELTDLAGNFSSELIQHYGVGAMVGFEGKIFGFRLGGIAGNWGSLATGRENQYNGQVTSMVRLGKVNKMYIMGAAFYDDFNPHNTIASDFKFGIGIGRDFFNWNNNSSFRFGLTNVLGGKSYFFESDIFLNKNIFISPNIRFGEHNQYGVGVGFEFR